MRRMLRSFVRAGLRLGASALRSRSSSSPSRAGGVVTPVGARDYRGEIRIAYKPQRNGDPDPGEVVWAWVTFEEDASQGKDRPVLVVGYAGKDLAVVMLSSQDHSDDRNWLKIGAGGWDGSGRTSSIRLDRPLAVPANEVRREGSALDRGRFDKVVAALRAQATHSSGWYFR
jgi:hypothetical protein